MPCADVPIAIGILELLGVLDDDEGADAEEREMLYNVCPESAETPTTPTRVAWSRC